MCPAMQASWDRQGRDTITERGVGAVPDLTIQPTAKFLKAGAILAGLIVVGLEVCCLLYWNDKAGTRLIMLFPPLILLWPRLRAIRRRVIKTVIRRRPLRYEIGGADESRRSL